MDISLSSKERIEMALSHKEPDRIPFDLGSTSATGIHAIAYKHLLSYLDLDKPVEIVDMMQQLAKIDEVILDRFKVDTRGLSPSLPSSQGPELEENNIYSYFNDRWGIRYKMPKTNGLYYDMVDHPLSGDISIHDINQFRLPEIIDVPDEFVNRIENWEGKENPPSIILEATEGGFLEISTWLRGFENFYVDIAGDPNLACFLMDKIIDFKLECWEKALKKIGKYITVAWESDDLGIQDRTMFSPTFYRKYIKPRHQKLFRFIKDKSPNKIYIVFHSCGSIYDLLPDIIETGVDAINPVQVSAAKMDTRRLKKEFGSQLSFWGGGVDTQQVLPRGSSREVRDEVRRRIDDLAPGGGFIFNPVHNIQADVPAENIITMWETFMENRMY